jgi:UDP-GlcNAc:undecaprenyl-phosphate/decaprenyl-phosphate GlcNAc-1-phosphate transferase
MVEAVLTFVVLAIVSAVLVRLMIAVGTLDVPVARSSHTVPTPKGGGVGIVAAFALGMVWHGRGGVGWAGELPAVAAAVALACFCYFDDVRDWPFVAKLAAQLAAAIGVMLCGDAAVAVALPGAGVVTLGLAGTVMTLGWILLVTNATNFIDGLNGLAAGCVLVTCLATSAAAPQLRFEALALAAGIAGCLPFNYPRARIFMGDVGSQACGFLLADFAVRAVADARASLVVPLALLPILADVAFTLARRALEGAVLTQAHRGHLYQVAQRGGVPAYAVAAVYWSLSAWGGLCGFLAGRALGVSWVWAAACLAAAAPMLPWGLLVARNARRAGITVW